MTIKLKQLPNREVRKVSIGLSPEIFADLEVYADIYERTYGSKEEPTNLIAPIIESFLASDSGFRKARKALQQETRKLTSLKE